MLREDEVLMAGGGGEEEEEKEVDNYNFKIFSLFLSDGVFAHCL